MIFSGLVFLSSCTDDDDTTPSNLKPSINFLVEQGYISGDATIPTSSEFKVKVFAEENPTSGANLSQIKVTRIFNLNSWDTALTINQSTYVLDATFESQAIAGQERIEFEVTDKDNQKAMVSLVITTEVIVVEDPVVTLPDIVLGSYNDLDFGSFYSIELQQVMFKTAASQNQGKIDFAFFKGSTTQNTIGAPASANVKDVFDLDWSVYNDTKIEKVSMTAAEFDAIGLTYDFPEVTATTNEVNKLVIGDVLVFRTVSGKVGYIKVDAIPAMRGDKLRIDVKVQQ